MVSSLFYYQLALFVLVWLFVMLHVTWSKPDLPTPPVPAKPKRLRSNAPKAQGNRIKFALGFLIGSCGPNPHASV
jgi:hypothetical protein